MSRPFGVGLLIAGIDEAGPQFVSVEHDVWFGWCSPGVLLLDTTRPSGTFMRYDPKAIGSGSEAAQSELQDRWYKVVVLLPQLVAWLTSPFWKPKN